MEKTFRLNNKRMVYPESRSALDQVSRKASANSNCSWISVPEAEEMPNHNQPQEEEEEGLRPPTDERQSMASAGSMGASRQFIQERMRHLVDAFTYRTQATRERIQMPQTPSSIGSRDALADAPPEPAKSKFLNDNFILPIKTDAFEQPTRNPFVYLRRRWQKDVIDPQGKTYVIWASIAALAVVYNMWTIPLRATFPFQDARNRVGWMFFDYLADIIYLIDIFVIQPRVMFLSEGFWMKDVRFTRQNYMRTRKFKLDMISILPLDLAFFWIGPDHTILRVPRLFKLHTFNGFFSLVDKLVSSPHTLRVARTIFYMIYMIHLNACAYYAFSLWEGIGANTFVYSGKKQHPYIKCFHFATKTATSIGRNPKPMKDVQFLFMTWNWLFGVFVFALLISQIRDIIATATRAQTEYRKLVDETLEYMRQLQLPLEMQRRVQQWFSYTWETQHTLDETAILDSLPAKMKTDIAINVYIEILSKVKLFADCDEALLRELVLQLRSVIYLPTDAICKRGDVGKEMYIVQSGAVQVMSRDGDEVLATLHSGSVFGEISLLGIEGMTRRTADVRSHGYSNLFVLSKANLNAALSHYPEAQVLLNRKAKALMKKNEDMERKKETLIVINNPEPRPAPKLLDAVMQMLPEDSSTSKLLRYGSRGRPRDGTAHRRKQDVRRSLPSVRDLWSAGSAGGGEAPEMNGHAQTNGSAAVGAGLEPDDDCDECSNVMTKVTVHRSMS